MTETVRNPFEADEAYRRDMAAATLELGLILGIPTPPDAHGEEHATDLDAARALIVPVRQALLAERSWAHRPGCRAKAPKVFKHATEALIALGVTPEGVAPAKRPLNNTNRVRKLRAAAKALRPYFLGGGEESGKGGAA